jgi:hypothetical protein
MNFDLNAICINDSKFSIIDEKTQTLKECFINTFIFIPVYIQFAVLSGYALGVHVSISHNFTAKPIGLVRILSVLMLLLIFVNLAVKYFGPVNNQESIESIFLLITDTFKFTSFFLYGIVIFNKNVFFDPTNRSLFKHPKKLSISFLLVVLGNLVKLINDSYAFFNFNSSGSSFWNRFNLGCTVALNIFLVAHLFVILVLFTNKCKKTPAVRRIINVSINNDDQSQIINQVQEEVEPFLIKETSEEDDSNYFSYLTFNWLHPLMKKGFRRQIAGIKQLPHLPIDLNVVKISERFLNKYIKNENKLIKLNSASFNEYTKNPIIEPDLLLEENFMNENATNYEEDIIIRPPKRVNNLKLKNNNLVKGLLKCFGRKFFILGVFKLLNDALNFSGPLLLNQLVQFVESKESKLKDGIGYALALFFTSLLSSCINIHFTNAMNKLCLRIRAALISLVYRKSATVKLNELNKFSIGQVVNYMSIDTGNIVNAFPSFHSLWSLPVQISITLYLLYQQIGISFLVGVAFVIILIPINKFLCDFIGKVQSKLMVFKDKRVKVIRIILILFEII